MNQYPVMEKENINSRSSLGIVEFPLIEWKFQTVDKALLLQGFAIVGTAFLI